ncbi:MAG: porin [Gammaproteobacteria bacterium]|nr:porin [Gammaproteobacteria bacterium]
MHRALLLLPLGIGCLSFGVVAQEAASVEEIIQQQQEQINALQEQIEATAEFLEIGGSSVTQLNRNQLQERSIGSQTSIGGYGEIHYNNLDAKDPTKDTDKIDFHRFVLFFAHEFNDRVSFFSELEVEHSLAGEGKPGEVEIEQAFVQVNLSNEIAIQGGLFVLPVGIINETHEPTTFYGVERNAIESAIVPATWWEGGAQFVGNSASGLSWNAGFHSGLEMYTTGSNAFRVRKGRQKVANAVAKDFAFTGRLRYTGMQGLDVAATWQYQSDPSNKSGDGLDDGILIEAHAIYTSGPFQLRALYAGWEFSGSVVEAANADSQSGFYIEPSWRINERWGVFARIEDVDGAISSDKFEEFRTGLSYYAHPNAVFKFDIANRNYDVVSKAKVSDFNGFNIGMAYQF